MFNGGKIKKTKETLKKNKNNIIKQSNSIDRHQNYLSTVLTVTVFVL